MRIRLTLLAYLLVLAPATAQIGAPGLYGIGTPGLLHPSAVVSTQTNPIFVTVQLPTSGTATQTGGVVGSSLTLAIATTASARRTPMPFDGTISALDGGTPGAQASGAQMVDEINGVAGTVVGHLDTAAFNSGASSDSFNSGDLVDWKFTPPSGGVPWAAGTSPFTSYGYFITSANGVYQALTAAPSSGFASGAVNANVGFGAVVTTGTPANTELNVSTVIPPGGDGTALGLFVYPNISQTSGNPHTYTVNKNGSPISGATVSDPSAGGLVGSCITIAGGGHIGGSGGPACASGFPTGSTVHYAAGDTISVNISGGSSAAAIVPGITILYAPDAPGNSIVSAQGNVNTGTDWSGISDSWADSSQLNFQTAPTVPAGKTLTLNNLITCMAGNPGGTATRVATLQTGSAGSAPATNTALTTTISVANGACPGNNSGVLLGGNQDTIHSYTLGSGSTVDLAWTQTGTPVGSGIWKFSQIAKVQ